MAFLALVENGAGTAVPAELKPLQGKWVVESMVADGQARPGESFRELRLEVRGDKYLVSEKGQTASRTLRLDASRRPRVMDITYDDGPNKGKTTRAIYVLEGDVLSICRHTFPDRERPAEFAAPAGTGRVVVRWKRVK